MKMLFVAVTALLATPAVADAVDSAYALCRVVDATGLGSAPCEVSGWNGTVTATMDMNSGEARDVCPKIANMMREKGQRFSGRQWTFQIKSPYSGDNSIAYCNLPQ
ncbi:hypothetical protein ABFT80_06145 [Mesorhizobium sp. SB112]|uniref:hypothetical protein n=1 Tax=Mesorhizobium sp. SB112 TaxID=3151853 RepID=UPI0032664217